MVTQERVKITLYVHCVSYLTLDLFQMCVFLVTALYNATVIEALCCFRRLCQFPEDPALTAVFVNTGLRKSVLIMSCTCTFVQF
jgi:hypothetical protein